MCQSVMQSQSRNDCWQLMGWLAALNMGFGLWRNNEPKRVWAVYDSHGIRKITKCRGQMIGDVSGRSPCCGGSNSATTPFLCLLPYPEGGGGGRSHASPKPGRQMRNYLWLLLPRWTILPHPWADRSPRPNFTYMTCVETCKSQGCLSSIIHSVSCFSVNTMKNQPSFLGFHGGLLP